MQTGVIRDFQNWCNMQTVPSTCSIHGAYWSKCFSKLMLALFIWKDQKQQLEQPEAKPSIWPGSLPTCPAMDHGTLCHLPLTGLPLSALCGVDSSLCCHLLKAGLLLRHPWLLSFTFLPSALGNCLPAHIISSLPGAVPSPQWALFSCFKLSAPRGTFPSIPGSGLMDKTSSHHLTQGDLIPCGPRLGVL